GGTPTAYQWTYSIDSGSTGNNPNVAFSAPTSASTTAVAHWYARPNSDCASNPPLTTSHPYYNSKYKIKVKVTFQGGAENSKDANFNVNAWWSPAGSVGLAQITGIPQMQETSPGRWGVVGPGTLARVPQQTPTIYVPSSSQFYNKTVAHENVHIAQWGPGRIFANYVTVAEFMSRISNITDTSEGNLILRLGQELDAYLISEANLIISSGDLNQAEIEAYAVSDPT